MITVCACDSQPIALEGLQGVLRASSEFEYLGGVSSLSNGFGLIERCFPSVALVDRSFGSKPVLDWITSVRVRYPQVRTVLWANVISDVECFRALQAGARGILRKSTSIDTLLECLRAVEAGQIWTENAAGARDAPPGARRRALTRREQEIIALVSRGLKNREIAEALSIATGTVKIHMMHVFEKTGIRDRFELAMYGMKQSALVPATDASPAGPGVPQAQVEDVS